MMKIKLMLITGLFLLANHIFSQNQQIVDDVQADFSNFTGEDALNLVPFQDKETGKYGYISALSKEIVVSAKYDNLYFFRPDVIGKYENKDFTFEIKDNKIVVKEKKGYSFNVEIGNAEEKQKIKKGFKVFKNDETHIEIYGDIYNDVYCVFNYEGKLYATAKIKDENGDPTYAIIDEDGNTSFGFDFNKYKYIIVNEYTKVNDKPYFLVVDNKNKLSFINLNGIKNIVSKTEGEEIYNSFFKKWTYSVPFGYGLYKDRILDFTTMKWLPAKIKKAEILSIEFASNKPIIASLKVGNDDPDVKLYLLVKDKKYPYPYYIDWDGYRYIP